MEFVFSLISSPLFWILAFVLKVVFQFLLAQKLRHPHAWFAFVPVLSGIQWFQLGQRSGWNLCWLWLPFVGILVYLYKWFFATVRICERSGERGSFSVLFLVPYINTVATMRLAFKTGFWVKNSGEEKLIKQVIKGLSTGHSEEELQVFATSHGIKLEDFEIALDRAQTITKNSLKLSSVKHSSPVALNIGIALAYFFGGIGLFFYAVAAGGASLFGALSKLSGDSLEIQIKSEVIDTSGFDPAKLEAFTTFVKVNGYEFTEESDKTYVSLKAEVERGEIRGHRVYLLDDTLQLLALAEKDGHMFSLGKGTISVKNQVDPSLIAYVGITDKLKEERLLVSREKTPLLIIEEQMPLPTNTNINDITAELRVSELSKSDNLYVYNQDRELIGAAKIQTIVPLDAVGENENGAMEPITRVKIRVELARKNIAGAQYLTTSKDLSSFDEYLDLLEN